MLQCECYMMFRGTMRITPLSGNCGYEVTGTWLYKPEYDCWYCGGNSYPAEICEVVEDLTGE